MNTAHEEAMRGLSPLHRFLFNLRPAWLASWLKRVLGIKRAVMETEAGRFYADPVSHFYAYSRVPGGYEPLLTSCVRSMLQPGDTFLDVGANESYFSILASSLVGPDGLVVAVEPQQRLNAVIQRNICENWRTTFFPCGMRSATRTVNRSSFWLRISTRDTAVFFARRNTVFRPRLFRPSHCSGWRRCCRSRR